MRHIVWKDERGVALPMGVLLMLVLTSLMLAFVSLAQTEPMIAANHLLASQARAQAEAGFERAVWALTQGSVGAVASPPTTPANAIDPANLPADGSVAPAPYDWSAYIVSGTTGGFEVKVTRTGRDEREIEAIGYAPGKTKPTHSRRRIKATVEKLPDLALNAPCALCVRGDAQIGGGAVISGREIPTPPCGQKLGALSVGDLDKSGAAKITGGTDGNSIPNQSTDYQGNAPASSFDGITLTSKDLKTLRDLAKQNGTYFGPGYPDGTPASSPAWTGSVSFDASHQVKDGIVFIDTVSGTDIPWDQSLQNPSDFASVTIQGNPFIGSQTSPNVFQGWLIVNGSLTIAGNMKVEGVVYVVDDLNYAGTGTGSIKGLAVSQNINQGTTTVSADSSSESTTVGNSQIQFDCENTRSLAFIPQNFRLKPGTYREVSD